MDKEMNMNEKDSLTPSRRIYDFADGAEASDAPSKRTGDSFGEDTESLKKLLALMQGDTAEDKTAEAQTSRVSDFAEQELLDVPDKRDERPTDVDDVDFTPLGRKREELATATESEEEAESSEVENIAPAEDDATPEVKEAEDAEEVEEISEEEDAVTQKDEVPTPEDTDEGRHIFRFAGERRDGVLHIEGTTVEATPRKKKNDGADLKSEELARDYSKSQIKKIARARMRTDIAYIRSAYNSRLCALEFECRTASLVFSKRKRKRGVRTEGEIRSEMNKLDRELKRSVRRERSDNKRYFKPLAADYSTARLPDGASRENLAELRDELFKLLAKRDELNIKLISLYSGGELGAEGGYAAMINAELNGKRAAYNKQKKIENLIYKHHVSVSHSKKIYALMDEYVELSGKISRIDFKLKRENPRGGERRSLRRERRKLKKQRANVNGDIQYNTKRSLEAAIARRRAKLYTVLGISLLMLLVAAGLYLWANGQSILDYFVSLQGG